MQLPKSCIQTNSRGFFNVREQCNGFLKEQGKICYNLTQGIFVWSLVEVKMKLQKSGHGVNYPYF